MVTWSVDPAAFRLLYFSKFYYTDLAEETGISLLGLYRAGSRGCSRRIMRIRVV